MSDNVVVEADPQVEGQSQEPVNEQEQESNEPDYKIEFGSLKKQDEELQLRAKSENSGLDRKISEMNQQIEEMKKASMNETEKLKYEHERLLEERQHWEKEKETIQRSKWKKEAAERYELPARFEKFIDGDSEIAMIKAAEDLKTWYENERATLKDQIIRENAVKPIDNSVVQSQNNITNMDQLGNAWANLNTERHTIPRSEYDKRANHLIQIEQEIKLRGN